MKANQAETRVFAVRTMCQVLGMSASGYYEWRARTPSRRAVENAALAERIEQIHRASDGTYGMPRIRSELRDRGDAHFDARWASVGRNRIARFMRQLGLHGVSRRRGFTGDRNARPAPDLVKRQFAAGGPDELWVSDITYVPTWAGFIFLAIVLDAWSRKVVGCSIGYDLRTALVIEALNMALAQRDAAAVIHHSDQGSQYTSLAFGRRRQEMGVKPSMGTVGDAYDNAMAESFFASLECELLDRRVFKNKQEAPGAVYLHRRVVQPATSSFEDRLSCAGGIRASPCED
jgi:putative transposase